MSYDISIIFITYNQDFRTIKPTLESLLLQNCPNYEIVISDDGSTHFPLDDILTLFEEHSFSDFQILVANENQGIVSNILAGLKTTDGEYVKVISPGDLLYSKHTLSSILDFSQKNGLKAGFGKVVAYRNKGECIDLFDFHAPSNPSLYLEPINQAKIIKSLMFADWIPGCSTFFEREFIIDEWEKLQSQYGVVFSEDLVMAQIAYEGYPILFLDENILWYDRNDGISSSGRKESVARLYADHERFFSRILQEHPNDKLLAKAKKRFDIRKALSISPIYGILRRIRERTYRSSKEIMRPDEEIEFLYTHLGIS